MANSFIRTQPIYSPRLYISFSFICCHTTWKWKMFACFISIFLYSWKQSFLNLAFILVGSGIWVFFLLVQHKSAVESVAVYSYSLRFTQLDLIVRWVNAKTFSLIEWVVMVSLVVFISAYFSLIPSNAHQWLLFCTSNSPFLTPLTLNEEGYL